MQMDICSRISFPVTDVNSFHGFCTATRGSIYSDYLVDELAYGATKLLDIQVDAEQVSASIPLHKKDINQIKNECLESHQSDADVITSEAIAHDDDAAAKSVNPHFSSAPSLPERLKPVSAMKGTREKYGSSPITQLTVKWAPDVYDPVPASSLHMVINRPNKQVKSKKKTKSKQKNKRGSKGKDKKQAG